MTIPGLAATGMLCMVFCWQEFMVAVSLTTYDAATLPVFLPSFVSGRGLYIAELSTMAVLMTIPVLIGGWLAQRRIIQGFALLDEH
jgi:sorbitol/mannitol transport system permease protein